MFGIEIIEVAIGLVLSFLAISTLCSGIAEVFVKLLSYRSKLLKKSIERLLSDSGRDQLVNELYKHHLIHGGTMQKLKDPEFIATEDFSRALVDTFINASPNMEKFQAVRNSIQTTVKDQKLRTQLLELLDDSMDDLVSFRKKLGEWFDKGMEDVTRYYRSTMRFWVTCIAVVVVISLNVDSFRISKILYNDGDLRAATVDAAQKFVDKSLQASNPMALTAADSTRIDSTRLSDMLKTVQGQIEDAHFVPVGWGKDPAPYCQGYDFWSAENWRWLALKFFGLIMTIGAVGMGAPYWQQQLKALLKLRIGVFGGGGGAASSTPTPPPAPVTVVVGNTGTPPLPMPPVKVEEEDTPDTNPV